MSAKVSKFVLRNINRVHLIICFDFILDEKANHLNTGKQKFLFNKSDFNNITDFISNIDLSKCFENKNFQQMFDELVFYTEEACNNFIPIKTIFSSSKIKSAWIDRSLKFLIRDKQNLRYRNCACKWKDLDLKNK